MKTLTEDAIIQLLQQKNTAPTNVVGIGDDAAVIERGDAYEVITKDLLIEDQHFRMRYFTPQQLAKKALHVNLSDIAAMGATPDYIFLGLSIPKTISPEWLAEFLSHISLECKKANVYLLGGDTTGSPHNFIISVTAIGHVENPCIKYRKGASAQDIICLLGYAGNAYAGLSLLEQNKPGMDALKECALSPTAMVTEGQWLGKQQGVTAMLDTSDGIYLDLQNLCNASKVGAILNIDTISTSPLLSTCCKMLGIENNECILVGGEDYGLLFTVKPSFYQTLKQTFCEQFSTPFAAIGVITNTGRLELQENNKPYPFHYKPFSHFK